MFENILRRQATVTTVIGVYECTWANRSTSGVPALISGNKNPDELELCV